MSSQERYFKLYKNQPKTTYIGDILAFMALLGILGLIFYSNWIL